jgi:hypothetical protein
MDKTHSPLEAGLIVWYDNLEPASRDQAEHHTLATRRKTPKAALLYHVHACMIVAEVPTPRRPERITGCR